MSTTRTPKGPMSHRFFIGALNVLLAILVYWLLGFILDDISHQPGPSWPTILKQFQTPAVARAADIARAQADKLSNEIDSLRKKQNLLQTSTQNYGETMNKLLALQKMSLQKNVTFPGDAQQNLSNTTKLFIANQQQFQELNGAIARADQQLSQTQQTLHTLDTQLAAQYDQASVYFQSLQERHNLKLALIKLCILIPLLLLAFYFFTTKRQSVYRPMIIAVCIAIFVKMLMVIHQHFPSRFFKYILILLLIAIVVRLLTGLLRMIVAPKKPWLQKQYREAYKKLECPICIYPIQPGALKFASLASGKLKPTFEPYACPSCGTQVFETCGACGHTRHALLMYCESCGVERK